MAKISLVQIAVVASLVLILDALAKLASQLFLPAAGLPLVPGVTLRVFENVRGPFGLGSVGSATAASVVVLAFLVYRRFLLSGFALGLLLGGGLANLGERLIFGRTTDVLVVGNLTALNLADLAVLVGVLAWFRALRRHPIPS